MRRYAAHHSGTISENPAGELIRLNEAQSAAKDAIFAHDAIRLRTNESVIIALLDLADRRLKKILEAGDEQI
jgi:hypothetical protein